MFCRLGFHRYEWRCLADYSGFVYPALFLVCSRCNDTPAFPLGNYRERPYKHCSRWVPEGFNG